LSIDPHDDASAYNIANVYEDMGDYQGAVKYYTKTIELNSDSYEAYLSRGYCYDSIGKYQLALKDFNKAIALIR
jgi:tetratricopeptide (TPR) repeat protein